MKLFVLLSRVPYPLEKGDKLRAYHQLRLLAKKHEICLCCLTDQPIREEHVQHLKGIVQHLHIFPLSKVKIAFRLARALVSNKPFQVHYFFQQSVAKAIQRELLAFNPDHIYCQLIRCAEYVKEFHQFKKTLDYMDALNAGHFRRIEKSPWYLKPFLQEESKRLVAYENLIFDYFDQHTIISAQDQQLIYHHDRKKIEVIPNGVDTDYFSAQESEKKYAIVFTGNMSYPPNTECAIRLAKSILPLVQKELPEASLLLAGATPTPEVLALAAPDVTVSGWLEDIREAYTQAHVFAAPMQIGSGLQNKLLEAMSMGLPSVTSPLAANAFGDGAAQAMCIAEGDEETARAIIGWIKNPERAKAQGQKGRDFVHNHFNWQATVNQLEKVFFS
jgi:polysaccharide biosynthesis protein PslH